MDWLEQVWCEVQDEIDYEIEHPQYPRDYEIANCGCVNHAEQGIPCPHDKLR